MFIDQKTGILSSAEYLSSPNHNDRPTGTIDLLVIHNISLPPGDFTGSFVQDFFLNKLDYAAHPYFESIKESKVSSHLFIRRNAQVYQFVPFTKRAWHAGTSAYKGRSNCNDFSIGIELEGTDTDAFTPEQYLKLAQITHLLLKTYPIPRDAIVGHSDIAPHRKTDPGPFFDWAHYNKMVDKLTSAS